jgi:lipoprotein-anchoring transpeptidase ErfK/SrfK
MAMKRLLITFLIITIMMSAVYIFDYVLRSDSDRLGMAMMDGDTILARLSDDPVIARKQIQKAKRALERIQASEPYIVINTHANKLTYRTADTVLLEGACSTGSGGELIDSTTGRHWVFNTPMGIFRVDSKLKDPWWRKPDWAYIEENEQIPKRESDRLDSEMMGDYAIGFGSGYFIHGTIYERLLGVSVTHGCIRLGADDLRKLYEKVKIGTLVYIF